MLRLRWSDPEPGDGSTPVPWQTPALIVAALFLNFHFWYLHGPDLWLRGPVPRNAAVLVAAGLLIAALFFAGPALATQTAKRPLFAYAEMSLGSIPAMGLRLCCVLFLVCWMASIVELPGPWFISFTLRREVSDVESSLITAAVLVFLFVTGLQSLRTTAKLAFFTTRLGIAILIAALFRVREGWPAILRGFPDYGEHSAIVACWQGLTLLSFYVGPLAFLGAGLGWHSQERRQVARIALLGIALPLSGTLLAVGIICVATHASQFYQPSLQPSVAMALYAKAASSALPGPLLVAAITIFGAFRFGAWMLREAMGNRRFNRVPQWILFGCLIGVIVMPSVRNIASSWRLLEMSATCLVVVASVATGDFLSGRCQVQRVQRIDRVGVSALLGGLATPLYLPPWAVGASTDPWWHPWLLPSYGVALLICVAGRRLTRRGRVQP